MPRPTTKRELLTANSDGYARLNDLIGSLSAADQKRQFPFEHRDKNLRDVLAHLHHWQLMMLGWYEVGMSGDKPDMPAKGYTWRTTPELNAFIWSKYQKTTLKQIRTKLQRTHTELQQLIENHTNGELFTKRKYHWTGSTSLGAYLTSASASHYTWAIKILRKFARSLDDR